MIRVDISDPELAEKAAKGGEVLRDLCRKEVDKFGQYLRQNEAGWSDGLSTWESQILKTYLYQKIRGRVDPAVAPDDLPQEGQNGTP